MDKKKAIADFLKFSELVCLPEKFTGQVKIVVNFNQGGVCSIEREVKDILK